MTGQQIILLRITGKESALYPEIFFHSVWNVVMKWPGRFYSEEQMC